MNVDNLKQLMVYALRHKIVKTGMNPDDYNNDLMRISL